MKSRFTQIVAILCLLCCFSHEATAQASVRFDYIKPVGDLGRRFNPGPGITLMYGPNNTIRRLNGMFYGSLFRITPQQDTLLSAYSVIDFGKTFVPGYQVYEPSLYLRAGGELTYRLYVDKPLTPIGLLNLGGILYTEKSYSVDGTANTDALLGKTGIEGGIGIGVEYEINQSFSARLSLSHSFAVFPEFGLERFWGVGINGIYYW